MRLGWITSSAQFHEQLVALTDSSSQHPHAFGQIFLSELFGPDGWQLAGFDKWVKGLGTEYKRRCDFFLDVFTKEVASTGFAEAIPPEAGMFVWTRIHVDKHPRYRREQGGASGPRTNCKKLMEELFNTCLDEGLVVMPASIFKVDSDPRYEDSDDSVEDVSTSSQPIGAPLSIESLSFVAPQFLPPDLLRDRGDDENGAVDAWASTEEVLRQLGDADCTYILDIEGVSMQYHDTDPRMPIEDDRIYGDAA